MLSLWARLKRRAPPPRARPVPRTARPQAAENNGLCRTVGSEIGVRARPLRVRAHRGGSLSALRGPPRRALRSYGQCRLEGRNETFVGALHLVGERSGL